MGGAVRGRRSLGAEPPRRRAGDPRGGSAGPWREIRGLLGAGLGRARGGGAGLGLPAAAGPLSAGLGRPRGDQTGPARPPGAVAAAAGPGLGLAPALRGRGWLRSAVT